MKKLVFTVFLSVVLGFTLVGCTEDIDMSARYVFKEKCIRDYLLTHPEYSEYCYLLTQVPVSPMTETTPLQLLGARGHYTVFAPTNEALDIFLDELMEKGYLRERSYDAFYSEEKRDSILNLLVLNSIIDSGDNDNAFDTHFFPQRNGEEFNAANMYGKKLTVYYQGTEGILINNESPINVRNRDITLTNGFLHQMEKVVMTRTIAMGDYLQDIIDNQTEGYLVMARAVQACGLLDTMRAIRDEVYEDKYRKGIVANLEGMTSHGFREGNTAYVPEHRKYGFTLFAERDSYWREQGLDPTAPDLLEKLQKWVLDNHQYSDDDQFQADANYESEDNLLNQWTTYHVLPMRIPSARLVYHENERGYDPKNPTEYTIPVYDVYTTFGKRRLLKLYESKESNGVCLNRFAKLDNARSGTYHELYCEPGKEGSRVDKESQDAVLKDLENGCIYPIEAPIAYTDEVRDDFHRQRIRYDAMALFPEAMTNDIRKQHMSAEKYEHVYIPERTVHTYFENLWTTEGSYFVYYNSYTETFNNLNIDEVKCVGYYDVTMKMPPVPRPGVYEIRWGYDSNFKRGMAQIYFGSDRTSLPASEIPLDLRIRLDEQPEIMGYKEDTDDEEIDSETDKRMRNKGYMKGPKAFGCVGHPEWTGRSNYYDHSTMRRIIVRQYLDPKETYYLRMKSVLDSDQTEFMMDMIEFCPKEVYDNPNEPEDIW